MCIQQFLYFRFSVVQTTDKTLAAVRWSDFDYRRAVRESWGWKLPALFVCRLNRRRWSQSWEILGRELGQKLVRFLVLHRHGQRDRAITKRHSFARRSIAALIEIKAAEGEEGSNNLAIWRYCVNKR